MKRGLTSLATIAATGTFVGVFGTVCGIIGSFRSVGGSRSQIFSSITRSISESLVTTVLGLFVAVLAVWAHRYLTASLAQFRLEMEAQSSSLVNALLLQLRRSGNKEPFHFVRTEKRYSAAGSVATESTKGFAPPRIGLLRQQRHGLLELVWPPLRTTVQAEEVLDRGLSLALSCGVLNAILYWRTPSKAIPVFLFLLVAGLAIRGGSVLLSAALPIGLLVMAAARYALYDDFQAAATLWSLSAILLVSGAFRAVLSPLSQERRLKNRRPRMAFSLLTVVLAPTTLPVLFPAPFFDKLAADSPFAMEPTVHNDDEVIALDQSLFGNPQVGDVVVVRDSWRQDHTARIVGAPGDRIQVRGGILWRNGNIVHEPYLQDKQADLEGDFPPTSQSSVSQDRSSLEDRYKFKPRQDGPWVVPADSYFLLVDDRSTLRDSRLYGPISKPNVLCRIVFAHNRHALPWRAVRIIH